MSPYGDNPGEADTFRQLTRVEARTGDNPHGHIRKNIHNGFEGYFSEVMSAGNLTKERQVGQILRLQLTAGGVQKSIPREQYDQTTLGQIMAAYSNGVTKVSQSAEGPGNLLTKLKTAISISQSTNRTDETLHAKGRVKG